MSLQDHQHSVQIRQVAVTKSPVHTTLQDVLQIDTIRDEIMYWLEPMDALNLRLTCRRLLPIEDMPRYTSIFKYIIPDRRWLCGKLAEGYTFTIFSVDLQSMLQRKARTSVGPSQVTPAARRVDAFLAVSNHKHLVPCTEEFMPTELFAMAIGDGTRTIPHESSTDNIGEFTRILVLRRFEMEINLTCRTVESRRSVITCPAIKTAFTVRNNADSSNVVGNQIRPNSSEKASGSLHTQEPAYAHMCNGVCEIRKPVKDSSSFAGSRDVSKTLFTIMIAREHSWLPAVFRFDMPGFECREYTLSTAEYRADVSNMFRRN